MPVKITITGVPAAVEPIEYNGKSVWRFDFVTGGSPNSPSELPNPSQNILYQVLVNKKQYKRLKELTNSKQLRIETSKLLIMGEPYQEMENGIVCYSVENLDLKKDKREAIEKEKPIKKIKAPKSPMQLTSLKVPDTYKEMYPRMRDEYQALMLQAIRYYQEHGQFEKPILLEKENIAWVVRGNYEIYMAARRLELTHGPVALFEEKSEEETTE